MEDPRLWGIHGSPERRPCPIMASPSDTQSSDVPGPRDGDPEVVCHPSEHAALSGSNRPDAAFQGAVALFKALGDERRLRTLELLSTGEACASEIAATFDEPMSTVSHRMRILEQSGLVARRREGRHMHFRLVDEHVLRLVRDALDHAME